MSAKRYTSSPCKRCGNTVRYISNRACVACVAAKSAACRGSERYEKFGAAAARGSAWQKANPERYAAIKAASVKRNSHTARAQFHRRRAAIVKAGGSYTADQITSWFRATPADFVMARLTEVVVEGEVRVCMNSLASGRRHNGRTVYEGAA